MNSTNEMFPSIHELITLSLASASTGIIYIVTTIIALTTIITTYEFYLNYNTKGYLT